MVTILGSSVDTMVLVCVVLVERLVMADSVVSWFCDCICFDSWDIFAIVDFGVVGDSVAEASDVEDKPVVFGKLVLVDLKEVDKSVVTESVIVGELVVVDWTVMDKSVVTDSVEVGTSIVVDDTDK